LHLDDVVDMAGFFFKDQIEPQPEDLIAKGLTAAESAHAARLSRCPLRIRVKSHQNAEPPMRELVEELGIKPGQLFLVFYGWRLQGKR
jgi:glutamyl-tRNA synthetase